MPIAESLARSGDKIAIFLLVIYWLATDILGYSLVENRIAYALFFGAILTLLIMSLFYTLKKSGKMR